ncbi:MAG: 6-hydroxymethylpterin diphosphokinase MptE-like protein [Candidatus Hodarchaeota archaeon]
MFGYSLKEDIRAEKILHKLLENNGLTFEEVKPILENKSVIIYGAGPSLPSNVSTIAEKKAFQSFIHVAADGAAWALLEHNIIPSIVVTDLDGLDADILAQLHLLGTIFAVHAHGDNIDLVEEYVPRVANRVIGTVQSKPSTPLINTGGFTDGDRAVCFVEAAKPKQILLVGMDFGPIIGRYSKPFLDKDVIASNEKRNKLEIARGIIEWILETTTVPIIDFRNEDF